MGCKEASATYVYCLNVLLLVLSLVVLAYSAYLTSELEDFSDAIDEGAIVAPLVFAAFMFVVSVIGICAVKFHNKILLFIYLIAAFVITLTVLISGAVLLSLSETVADAADERVIDAADTIEGQVVDFGLAVFQVCCSNFDGSDDPVVCGGDITETCISDIERFVDIVENIPEELCELLEDVDFDGAPIVGDPAENGGCAGGDPETFVTQVLDFLSDNLEPLGIVNLVLSIVMLLDLIMTCVLLWSSKDDYNEDKKNEDYNDQAGPDVAQGTEVKY